MATEQDIPQPAAMSRSDDPLSKLYREFGILALAAALAATAYREVTIAQDNANEASSRGGNSRADMFETRDFYLACYLRCAGYELRPPRVERGFRHREFATAATEMDPKFIRERRQAALQGATHWITGR
jgi:hypothetical protein